MLRPLKPPADLSIGVDLVLRGFQDTRADKKEVAVDALKSLRNLWPLIRIGGVISPSLRDSFQGFIWEEDAQPVGFVTFAPESTADRWEIGIIVVLPEYRGRGIARKLMQASIDAIRVKRGKVIVLDAAAESEAACILYEKLGFERVFTSIEFNLESEIMSSDSLPAGYELISLPPSDWRTRYELDQRITPAHTTRYDPMVESRFHTPWIERAIQSVVWQFSGQKSGQVAMRSSGGQIVAWGSCLARIRPGGVNYLSLRVDPQHDLIPLPFEVHLIRQIQQISPGRRIMFAVPDWQESLVQSSLAIGCTERTRYRRMGMFV